MARYPEVSRFGIRGILLIAVVAVGGLLVAACSASGANSSTSPTQAPVVAGTTPVPLPAQPSSPATSAQGTGQTVQANLTEFTINLSTTTMKAGHVQFDVSNTGKFTHALEITGQGVDMKTQNLNAGQTATLEMDLVPGKYEVLCPVGNHKDRGMDTTITVQ